MSKKDDELNDFVDEVTDADDQRAWNAQDHVRSHRTEGDYFHTWSTWQSCHAREDETHSEGQDTDGGEHL